MAATSPPGQVDPITLSTTFERITSLVRRLAPTSDVSLTAASTLATLAQQGPSRVSDLAVREGVTQPAMTQLVSRMEQQGYLRRQSDSSDARVVLVELTAAGAELLRSRREIRGRRLHELVGHLDDDERAALAAALPALNLLADLGHDVERSMSV